MTLDYIFLIAGIICSIYVIYAYFNGKIYTHIIGSILTPNAVPRSYTRKIDPVKFRQGLFLYIYMGICLFIVYYLLKNNIIYLK